MRDNRPLSNWNNPTLLATLLGLVLVAHLSAQEKPNADQRAKTLLSQMTLEEKIGQMTQVDMNALKDKADIKNYFLGSMLSGGDSDPSDLSAKGWAAAVEEYKPWAFKTRLKIPLLYGIDAVHGHNNVDGAVIFPHHIGMGATRDEALMERAGRVTASELAATGIRWAFGPCLAVPQDPRWGRTYEGFGSRPELAELLGAAEVRGLQGTTMADPNSVVACAKHFLADGGTRDGIDQGNAECDEATLRKVHLPGYVAAIKAGVGTIMVSYSSWNGKKMHGNKYLLTDVLKGELGFKGFVVSDWAAIDQLSPDYRTDIETAINAGLDMVMIPNGPGQKNNYIDFIRLLKELVAEGRVSQTRIDDAVSRILRVKFELGLFDEATADRGPAGSVGSPEHRQVARECVRESLVLLKNEGRVLPLSKKMKRLQVVGKAAADLGMQCGGWTITWQGKSGDVTKGGTTILDGIRKVVSVETEVSFSPIAAGVKGSDAVVVVVGEMPYAEMKGDRHDLRLGAEDIALIQEVKKAGVPVVTILLSGRPLILGSALSASDAFVAAWLPGTEGQGVADVLFGDYKPNGKLPCTWLASMDELTRASGGKSTLKPLFDYGFGLTYGPPQVKTQRGLSAQNGDTQP
jgi:beta-glucosidase